MPADSTDRRDDPRVPAAGVFTGCSAALARGVEFLLAGQGRDGLWRDFRTPAGEASAWPTGYVGCALDSAGGGSGDGLNRAAQALLRGQHASGGWGYHAEVPDDADSTAWVLLFLARRLGPEHPACRRAVTRLAEHQQRRTGGVRTYAASGPIRRYTGLPRSVPFWGWCRSTVEVSAVAGAAFALAGAPVQARAAWRYVRARQARDGHWDAYWWNSPLVATWHAAALAGAHGDYESQQRAAAWALETQLGDGSWCSPRLPGPSAFASALALAVLASSGADHMMPLEHAVAALAGLQRPDGSWPAHARLRIPAPADRSSATADRWRPVRFAPGVVVSDHNRGFTTATCVAALASALAGRAES